MGVDLGDLVEREETSFEDLNDKEIGIDAMNVLYQFLSVIRQRDGTPLKDSDGNITSHLSGLFYRNTRLLKDNIRPVYIFDGSTPEMKSKETSRRKKKREEALEKWKKLKEEGKVDEAYSKATQSSKVTGGMIKESKELLEAMGIPYIQAPSEGEAQASHMVNEGDLYGVGSQDWDCLLFGAERMIRNLTSSRTRKTSGGGRKEISPEKITLESVLDDLDICHTKLIWMGVLMGTDFNPDGVKGIGPKTSLKLVKKYDDFGELMNDDKVKWEFDKDPESIISFFEDPPVDEGVSYSFGTPEGDKIREILIEKHDFSSDRVNPKIKELKDAVASRQSGLDSFV